MMALLEVLKTAAFSTLAALLAAPWLSERYTVMLGVALFWANLVRITPRNPVKRPPES